MTELIPWSPMAAVYAIALAAVSMLTLWRSRDLFSVVAIMIANWMATRAVSAFELPGSVQAVADLTSAALLLAMWRRRAIAVLPVAALFGLMVFFSGVHDLGLITRDTMWAWADVLAYGQLIIIAGAAARGGGRPRLAVASHRRGRTGFMAFAVARRVQGPPHT